ncbi:hypothetical protein DY000_02048687 [Brassica cretica]|uniref:Uncharacterized protein n=1 Tax=Brassica cretica TaxID=69181 RepID=A0ABQ7ET42_BRACR|nr:hypothetical protein DY000_02048687 [Brassica cretica]
MFTTRLQACDSTLHHKYIPSYTTPMKKDLAKIFRTLSKHNNKSLMMVRIMIIIPWFLPPYNHQAMVCNGVVASAPFCFCRRLFSRSSPYNPLLQSYLSINHNGNKVVGVTRKRRMQALYPPENKQTNKETKFQSDQINQETESNAFIKICKSPRLYMEFLLNGPWPFLRPARLSVTHNCHEILLDFLLVASFDGGGDGFTIFFSSHRLTAAAMASLETSLSPDRTRRSSVLLRLTPREHTSIA